MREFEMISPFCARNIERAPPAGPVPTIKQSVVKAGAADAIDSSSTPLVAVSAMAEGDIFHCSFNLAKT